MFKKVDCKMEARAGVAVALLLVGCSQPQIERKNAEPIVAVSSPVVSRPAQGRHPQRLKLRLTLDRTEDLQVNVNDSVAKGQVVSQRSTVRARLIQERAALHQQLQQLRNGPQFPSYAVEQAEVEQARLRVKQARGAIAIFYADSPWTDYARRMLTLPDRSQLRALEDEHQDARGELAIAVAKLQKAQQQRAVKPDASAKRAELLRKIREIEEQLDSSEAVRSPYAGVVKAIKWLEQIDQAILVEVTLMMDAESRGSL